MPPGGASDAIRSLSKRLACKAASSLSLSPSRVRGRIERSRERVSTGNKGNGPGGAEAGDAGPVVVVVVVVAERKSLENFLLTKPRVFFVFFTFDALFFKSCT